MSGTKIKGGLMEPAHIFKMPKRGEPVAELPASLVGEEMLKSMKEQPKEIVPEPEKKPKKKKNEIIDPDNIIDEDGDNGDSPAE